MRKLFVPAAAALTVGILMMGNLVAQQTPAATTKPAPAKTSTAAKSTSTTAAKTPAPPTLTTQKDKVSYAIGMNIGESMKKDSLDINADILARGMKDAMSGGKLLLTDEQVKQVMTELRTEVTQRKEAEAKKISDTNKQEGQQFLATNKSKPGVVALPSGLQYKIVKEGTGPKPAATDTVVCNYRGTLINGTEFDSSYKGGQPATFPVDKVIKGWTEALQLMPVGSKWEVYVPSDMAYGERSPGPEIGPNSTLIFEIDLLSIQDKNAAPAKQ
ncbi:MAG: FKBP-type peptidyl-prolyl cis-trans isomerase [Candidatus Korobacteraceae bacterium]